MSQCPQRHFGGRRSVGAVSPSFLSQSHGEHGGVSEFQIFRVSAFSAKSFPSARCLLTALRSGCPPWATHLSFPLDMRYRAGVRSRSVDSQDLPTCSSFGAALRQSISTFPEGLDSLRANLRLLYLAPAPALDCLKTLPADIYFLLILKILQILSKRKINRD